MPARAIVFAANTDVGKTLFAAALCRAAVTRFAAPAAVAYLKPIQTGYPADSDARFVAKFCPRIHSTTLFTFSQPVSPHNAAIMENRPIADSTVLQSIRSELDACSLRLSEPASAEIGNEFLPRINRPPKGFVLLETAGGVNSPTLTNTLQSNLYKPFAPTTPCVLVGDSRLGGISTTLTSYESLAARGYAVPLVLMFADALHRNHEVVSGNVDARRTRVVAVPPPPPKISDPEEADDAALLAYYESIDGDMLECIAALVDHSAP